MKNVNDSNFEPVLQNDFGDVFLHSVNGDSFLKQNAFEVFKQNLGDSFFQENTYHVVIGTDSGLLIQYLVENGITENSRYVFIELPKYIDLIRPELPADWQEVLKFCTPTQWLDNFDQEEITPFLYNKKVILHRSISTVEVNNPNYHLARIEIEQAYEELSYSVARMMGDAIFIERQLFNAVDNTQSYTSLAKRFNNKTCVILGGGPSLDQHMAWIAQNRPYLVVIAAARISKKLINEGLIPDVVISVDPHLLSYENSKEMLLLPKSTILINSNHIFPGLLSQWHGHSFYAGSLLPWDNRLDNETGINSGPTVVNFALNIAIELGFKNIFLTGTDLCYSRSGASHAKGSFEDVKGIDISNQELWIETYSGLQAETNGPFLLASKTLNLQGGYAITKGARVYNLSYSAAKVDNIEYIDVMDVELDKTSQPNTKIFKSITLNSNRITSREHLMNIDKEFARVVSDLNKICELASDAIVINKKMCAVTSSYKIQNDNKIKLDNIEKKLQNKYQYLSSLIKTIAIADFVKTLGRQANDSLTSQEIELTGRLYYQAYISGCKVVLGYLVVAQERVAIRLATTNKTVDIEHVNNYWIKRKEFLALENWYATHGDIKAVSSVPIEQLIAENQVALTTYHDEIDGRCSQQTNSLDKVPYKIRCLFFENNVDGLTLILEQLTKMADTQIDATNIAYLASAYKSLIDGEMEQSLIAFKQVDERFMHAIEFKQMASVMISLSLFGEAEILLKKLSQLTDVYLPLYASILKVNGHNDSAVVAYSSYLEKYNQDVAIWCELGQLFMDMGAFDSAKMAFEYTLNLEPNNVVATHGLQRIV